MQILNLQEFLASFHVSHIKIGQAVVQIHMKSVYKYEDWLVTHENGIEFCVDFKSAFRNTNFPIAKKFIFLPYANLCKSGGEAAILTFSYAEPSKDQMCHFSYLCHY